MDVSYELGQIWGMTRPLEGVTVMEDPADALPDNPLAVPTPFAVLPEQVVISAPTPTPPDALFAPTPWPTRLPELLPGGVRPGQADSTPNSSAVYFWAHTVDPGGDDSYTYGNPGGRRPRPFPCGYTRAAFPLRLPPDCGYRIPWARRCGPAGPDSDVRKPASFLADSLGHTTVTDPHPAARPYTDPAGNERAPEPTPDSDLGFFERLWQDIIRVFTF